MLWTALAVASANVLLAYFVATAIWPMRVPALGPWPVAALVGAGGLFALLALRGWLEYLRARRPAGS